MKRSVTTLLLFLSVLTISAQSTDRIVINGRVKSEKTISISDLEKFALQSIGDLPITNHKGEVKGTAKAMKGVRLCDALKDVELDTDNPKTLSEYYFVATAADGYKVVFSWNELFNSPTTETVFIVMEKDGKKLAGTDDAILTVATKDFKTGRRYIKNLSAITVGRAN